MVILVCILTYGFSVIYLPLCYHIFCFIGGKFCEKVSNVHNGGFSFIQ